ncbi:hypothetical protein AeRB84_015331 [Aphanomyces euteiches]|nr:hypothetical protein AeRB84_015331 [Aphanomyces euteiches]
MASCLAVSAVAAHCDEANAPCIPQQRFVRPNVSYIQLLEAQKNLLCDGGDRIVVDNFRMGVDELESLVEMSRPYISDRLCVKTVVWVAVHWMATGASVRAQEQFFVDKGFSRIHEYRHIGMLAILRGLSENGFYGGDVNEKRRIERTIQDFNAMDPCFRGCIGAIDDIEAGTGIHPPMYLALSTRKAVSLLFTLAPRVVQVTASSWIIVRNFSRISPMACSTWAMPAMIPLVYLDIVIRYHLREWSDNVEARPSNFREIFNYRHSKARIIVEQAFGLLKRKWRILGKPIECEMGTVNHIVHTCCALHNFILLCRPDVVAIELTQAVLDDDEGNAAADLHELEMTTPTDASCWRDTIAMDMWNVYELYLNDD